MSTTDKKPFSFSAAAKAWRRSAPAWEMSVRDHFAFAALREAMRDPLLYADEKRTASWAYTVADAMCDEREKRNQEGACAVSEPPVSDRRLDHTHEHGAAPSLSTTDADGHSIGRPGAASTPFDEACTGQPLSSPWSLEQRRAAELVAQAEEVCGIDAACAVMKEKACLFADSLNAEIEDLRGCRETLQNHVEIRTAERNVAQSRADTLEAVLLEAQRASPSARFLVIDRQRIDKAIEQARAALSSPAAAERSGET